MIQYDRSNHCFSLSIKTKWFAATLSVIFALLISEAVTRLWLIIKTPVLNDERCYEIYEEEGEYFEKNRAMPLVCLDTYLGYAAIPNQDGKGYHINSEGFRDEREFSKAPRSNEFRIFITGGSTAFGSGAQRQELTIGTLLEKGLNHQFPEKDIVVINAAFPGYCLTQERIMLENRILDFNPHLVLLFTGFNDLVYAYGGVDTLRIQDHFTWRGRIEKMVRTADNKNIPPEPLSSDRLFKLRYLLDRFLWEHKVGKRKKQLWTYTEKRTPLPPERFETTIRRNLNIIGALSRDRSFSVIIALQPIFLETRKNLSNHEKKILQDAQGRDGWVKFIRTQILVLRRLMHNAAGKYGMTYTSLTDVFDQCEKPIFYDDCHFGDRGNRIVANRLAALVSEELRRAGL